MVTVLINNPTLPEGHEFSVAELGIFLNGVPTEVSDEQLEHFKGDLTRIPFATVSGEYEAPKKPEVEVPHVEVEVPQLPDASDPILTQADEGGENQ